MCAKRPVNLSGTIKARPQQKTWACSSLFASLTTKQFTSHINHWGALSHLWSQRSWKYKQCFYYGTLNIIDPVIEQCYYFTADSFRFPRWLTLLSNQLSVWILSHSCKTDASTNTSLHKHYAWLPIFTTRLTVSALFQWPHSSPVGELCCTVLFAVVPFYHVLGH